MWRSAERVTGFLQRDPTEGAQPSESTVVYIAYDDAALYVAARLYDSGGMAQGNQFTRDFAEFLPEFPVRCLDRGFVGFDAAADHFQRRPVNRVFPLEDEPDISVLLHSEHAGSVFNLDELVNHLGPVWKYDTIFAKPHEIAVVNIPAGH